ncbi:hypothetical protein MKK68_02190 [Methylobacterium sp. E-016]|uniref:hypothetical protein n=1 Tax=Methylobacterium sp. E-016 TaxID=2836556 RepID=UPI001FBADDFC|nr:hypothetical protein [Methylobacterium sp. E-016]MCJ2074471.1 hypothetical protein [Methylobacterium sp. E-016]
MSKSEFTTIAAAALAGLPTTETEGSMPIEVVAIRPSPHGPLIEWRGGPPRSSTLLAVLARATALRWRDGTPRIPEGWRAELGVRFPRAFEEGGPNSWGGWRWLWEAGASMIEEAGGRTFKCEQTKEKFGSIRWYYSLSRKHSLPVVGQVARIVANVEHLSAFTCEFCGAPGKIRSDGWAKACCNHHADRKNRVGR